MTNPTLTDFFKKSLGLIDEQDIDREINETQLKYGTTLMKKDLDVLDLENQINSINKRTTAIKESNKNLKEKLVNTKQSLNDK